jgi:hypothetical protein
LVANCGSTATPSSPFSLFVSTENDPAAASAPPPAGRIHTPPPFEIKIMRSSGNQRKSVSSDTPVTKVGSRSNISAGLGLPTDDSSSAPSAGIVASITAATSTTGIRMDALWQTWSESIKHTAPAVPQAQCAVACSHGDRACRICFAPARARRRRGEPDGACILLVNA